MKNLPTFEAFMNEGKTHEGSCMSEGTHKKMNELREGMMKEMKAYHEDEHEDHTAEGYMGEAKAHMDEMMEEMNEMVHAMAATKRRKKRR